MPALAKNVLVIGAGQVGTFAARALSEAGIAVVAADVDPAPGYFARFGPKHHAELLAADLQDGQRIASLLHSRPFEAVVLSGGLVGVACDNNPQKAWEVNVAGATNVAELCLEAGVHRLVFISTLAVYGWQTKGPVDEASPLTPQSEYGRTKAAAESALCVFRKKGLDLQILRPCGTYGPLRFGLGSHSAQFIESILFLATHGRNIVIQASQAASDEYIYVKDLGRAIALATICETQPEEFVFNVSSGKKSTAYDVRSALQTLMKDVRVEIQIVEDKREFIGALDVTRFTNAFQFRPRFGLVEGFSDYLQEEGLRR